MKNCIAIPRLLYVLRACPCFSHPLLEQYDSILKQGFEHIVNTPVDDRSWPQATLPVSFGGLGIRRAVDLAAPAFSSSAFSVRQSVNQLSQYVSSEDVVLDRLPVVHSKPNDPTSQRAWDALQCEKQRADLLRSAPEGSAQKRRLQAATAPQSGAWLNAIPSATLGLKLDDEQLRIAVALRIGVPICQPHQCRHCQAPVDSFATHGLSCRYSAGRHPRHRSVNELLRQAFGSAAIPAVTEPPDLSRSDGKRPDGMTLVPWARGCALVWDCTCVDTMANSNREVTSAAGGGAAENAFRKKEAKYQDISKDFFFMPVAMETFGAWARESLDFIRDLGRRICRRTGEARSTAFLLERIWSIVFLTRSFIFGQFCVNLQ